MVFVKENPEQLKIIIGTDQVGVFSIDTCWYSINGNILHIETRLVIYIIALVCVQFIEISKQYRVSMCFALDSIGSSIECLQHDAENRKKGN